MKPQLLKVLTPNKMLFIKGRLVRSPLETIITNEKDLNLLKLNLKNLDVQYTIIDYKKEELDQVIVEEKIEEPIKTKKKSEPKTTLEKIAADIE